MKKRDLLIFLNTVGFSSESSLKIFDYLIDNNIEIDNFSEIDYVEKEVLKTRSFNKLQKFSKDASLILEKVEEETQKKDIKITTILDDDFPESLKLIENPPSVLYIRGNLNIYNPIAFVGARSHSSYGKVVVDKIIDDLSIYDFTIVSGMAYGIDSISHRRALENNLNTIAVLGTGVDVPYPKSNRSLYEEIIEKGAVISEFPLGKQANIYTFPMRNRIISGLSDAVIVAEAKDKSGSLITARLAAEQGKEVFGIPGNINSIYSVGTNKLIRDGAIPLIDASDIIRFYPNLNNTENKAEEVFELEADELLIYNEIQKGNNSSNDICNNLKLDVFYINKLLTKLELKGIIEKISMNEFQILK